MRIAKHFNDPYCVAGRSSVRGYALVLPKPSEKEGAMYPMATMHDKSNRPKREMMAEEIFLLK
jgi:hypothetical protein